MSDSVAEFDLADGTFKAFGGNPNVPCRFLLPRVRDKLVKSIGKDPVHENYDLVILPTQLKDEDSGQHIQGINTYPILEKCDCFANVQIAFPYGYTAIAKCKRVNPTKRLAEELLFRLPPQDPAKTKNLCTDSNGICLMRSLTPEQAGWKSEAPEFSEWLMLMSREMVTARVVYQILSRGVSER